jgi:hypothetical protein
MNRAITKKEGETKNLTALAFIQRDQKNEMEDPQIKKSNTNKKIASILKKSVSPSSIPDRIPKEKVILENKFDEE